MTTDRMPLRPPLFLGLATLAACTSDPVLEGGPAQPDAATDAGSLEAPDPESPEGWSWEQQVVTDATWLVDGTMPASIVRPDCVANEWPRLNPAHWIWRAPCTALDRETRFFLKTFRLPETPQLAQLEVVVDDYAYLELNDRRLQEECTLQFGSAIYGPASVCGYDTVKVHDVVALLQPGDNTIRVIVHNAPNNTTGEWTNAAGLNLRLTIKGGRRTGQR